MNYSSETINKLYYGDRLINISVTNGGGGGIPMPSNLSTATLNDYGLLTSAVIKSGITSIGNMAFIYCTRLASIEIPNSVTSIGNKAFYYCESLKSIDIPSGVTSIGQQSFQYCTSLSSITIPDSVTSIDQSVFRYCTSLTSCTIGSGVTSIGQSAFQNCSSLRSVIINATTPPTLASANAFNNANNCPIYVPSGSVDTYKAANVWSSLASRIQAIGS